MYLYPYKIFALSKNKRLFNIDNPNRTLGIYDVECSNWASMNRAKSRVNDARVSILLGEVKKGVYLNVLDLDDCFDENGDVEQETKDLLDYFEEYEWEVSSSGTGMHIYVLTTKKYNTFIVKGLIGCKSFEFYADKRHIVTTTFDFENTSLKIDAHNDLLDSILAEVEEQKNSALEAISQKDMALELFEGTIDNDESKVRGVLLGRTPVTKISELRKCCLKDSKLKQLIDENPDNVDQSAHDCSLIAKLLYYTLSYEGAWELAKKTNYYQNKDTRHKLKFDKPEYRQRTNSYISNGRY